MDDSDMQPRVQEQSTQPEASTSGSPTNPKPTVIIVIGMAGSGKTTLIQRLQSHLHTQKQPPYIINMDPAVTHMPYSPNIDIRDTVKYKNVMKQYNLGPNGGILTSCNLFATRFDQVIGLLEKPRDPPLSHVLLDTPGQIEIFTWSASGQIVTELLASSFPTCVVYVVDTPRCTAPQTFMSNMLQAVSILYKTKLPMILAFNKTDVTHHGFAQEWMDDFDTYHAALEADATYAATLSRSLSLVLDEFYKNLRSVGVSALTGAGMDEFFQAVKEAGAEYDKYYLPELEQRRKDKEAKKLKAQQDLKANTHTQRARVAELLCCVLSVSVQKHAEQQMEAVRRDLAASNLTPEGGAGGAPAGRTQGGKSTVVASAGGAALGALAVPDFEEEDDEDEDEEGCDYELSDESIEDEEEEKSRQESRAK